VSTSSAKHSRVYASTPLSTGSPVRTPPHHAQNPRPTPGSTHSAPPAAFPHARNASASSAIVFGFWVTIRQLVHAVFLP
jgi:hypothetical protein